MKFLYASAIIPLCFQEPQTDVSRKLAEEDGAMVAWCGMPVECYSAFARLRREGILDPAEEAQAVRLSGLSWPNGQK